MTEETQQAGLIVFEGVDGAGKGVQSRALEQRMRKAGLNVLLTREPGGSESAELIRQLIVEGEVDRWDDISELLLIYAARRSHLRETILPALANGTWVISDRFADSSRAFQGIAGGLGLPLVEQIHQLVVGDFVPAMTLIIDLDPALSLQRAEARGGKEDRFEQKGLEYQNKVRKGFLQLAAASPETHVVIDGSGTIETVESSICEALEQRLGLKL
ncbi:MAG: dTMP kinase [Gammaproteobacteria bacterium]|nr:dTMP kinase [Gammaproteobacteria bacterium]MAY02502.1 dTMP kinase [Gammaproteobacteria bacterium]|tara:strand:+ start:112 stop:759 length:648 start_codon:yes stop_codon:yes gene_type:complete